MFSLFQVSFKCHTLIVGNLTQLWRVTFFPPQVTNTAVHLKLLLNLYTFVISRFIHLQVTRCLSLKNIVCVFQKYKFNGSSPLNFFHFHKSPQNNLLKRLSNKNWAYKMAETLRLLFFQIIFVFSVKGVEKLIPELQASFWEYKIVS